MPPQDWERQITPAECSVWGPATGFRDDAANGPSGDITEVIEVRSFKCDAHMENPGAGPLS